MIQLGTMTVIDSRKENMLYFFDKKNRAKYQRAYYSIALVYTICRYRRI